MKVKVLLLFVLPGLIIQSCNSAKEGVYEEDAISALDKLTETMVSWSHAVTCYPRNLKMK